MKLLASITLPLNGFEISDFSIAKVKCTLVEATIDPLCEFMHPGN